MPSSKLNNSSLIFKSPFTIGDGNQQIFSAIFEKYYASLCLFAARIVPDENAEDVIEEMFVSLWNKQRSFNDEEHLKAFLYHAAKNACIDFLRFNERANLRNTTYTSLFDHTEESYLAEITRAETIRELYQAIDELPLRCGEILKMGYFEGLSNAEIAEKLGISLQTVKNQKRQAIALLKKQLPAEDLLLIFMMLHCFK